MTSTPSVEPLTQFLVCTRKQLLFHKFAQDVDNGDMSLLYARCILCGNDEVCLHQFPDYPAVTSEKADGPAPHFAGTAQRQLDTLLARRRRFQRRARRAVRQLPGLVEASPEPLPTVCGALGQIRLPS